MNKYTSNVKAKDKYETTRKGVQEVLCVENQRITVVLYFIVFISLVAIACK